MRSGGPAWLTAGVVGRPHGLDGSFLVQRARSELLEEGASVSVAGRAVRIVRRAGMASRPIVRLEGCEHRDDAAGLRGEQLMVARQRAPQLGTGEWWAEDLEGCRVVDDQRPVGVVRRLVALPSCEALEVERDEGGELLVPLVGDAVRDVDVERGRIDVSLRFVDPPRT
ncbi:MAG TPA: ribosome maturation factor RimM [Solirubrobacteraceae bacterium]|nr:ribosome maturation factor RimM [Solirubrobacteraceae bacterium]